MGTHQFDLSGILLRPLAGNATESLPSQPCMNGGRPATAAGWVSGADGPGGRAGSSQPAKEAALIGETSDLAASSGKARRQLMREATGAAQAGPRVKKRRPDAAMPVGPVRSAELLNEHGGLRLRASPSPRLVISTRPAGLFLVPSTVRFRRSRDASLLDGPLPPRGGRAGALVRVGAAKLPAVGGALPKLVL